MKTHFVLLLLLVSCGNPSPAPVRGPELIVQMPAALAKDSQRYKRFLSRASHLALILKSKEMAEHTQVFPAESWEELQLPLGFPGALEEPLEVRVEIWDRNREGRLRRDPALQGAGELKGETKSLRIKLRLNLSPREYD